VRRAGLAAFLLVASACGFRDGNDPRRLIATATQELRYGDIATALSLADQGIELTRPQPNSVEHQELRLLRGEILLLRRELEDVTALLGGALPAEPGFARLAAKQAYLRGHLLVIRGSFTEALATLEEADRLAIGAGAEDISFGARALRGQALLRTGRFPEGLSTLTALATDAERASDEYHLAIALINTGMGHQLRDRFDAALPFFERAASLTRVTMRIRAPALTNAGLCYARLGDYDRAIGMQRQAVAAHENGARPFLVQALGELGTTYLLKGDSGNAIANLTRALQVANDAGLRREAQLWAAHLALVHIRLGEWDEAEEYNRQSRRLADSGDAPQLVYNTLYDADIAFGRGDLARADELYRSALGRAGSDPFNKSDAHAGLARVAVATGEMRRASTEFEAALRIIERTQTDLLKTDYKLSYLTRLEAVYDQYVDALMSQRQFDRALEVADSSRARVLAERQGVSAGRRHTAAEFKLVAARSGRTLLAYWLGASHSYAWIVAGSAIRAITLPPESEIEPLVRAHQQALVDALADPVRTAGAPGDALYTMLVAPFERQLKPGAGVVIVPDGALSRMNFETLPVPGARRHYWIEDVVLAVAPSLGTLAAAAKPRARPAVQSVLLVGDPLPADDFPRLQYAAAEIDGVAGAFPDARKAILRGKEASPQAFAEARPQEFSLIHFTAHASANAESPLDSAVILSPAAGDYKLYARDIAGQALDADLVTISACRSAGDRTYAGEGLVGFAWAFLRAGASRVLAGLWDVDDRSTAELMTATYAALARQETPAAALRSAKLALIARGGAQAKPYYWGPFQLIVATP
jgi:CHAT domain-containing protein